MHFSPVSQMRLSKAKEPEPAASQFSLPAPVHPASACSGCSCSLQSRPLNEAKFYPAKVKLTSRGLDLSSVFVWVFFF